MPSILAVTSEIPWPLDSGGHLRTYHILRRLASRFRIRLVTACARDGGRSAAQLECWGIGVIVADTLDRSACREGPKALRYMARGEPYIMYGRHDRGAIRDAICGAIESERPDLLYLDHLDSFAYRDIAPDLPAVLDLHNVYSTLALRASQGRSRIWERIYLEREARLLDAFERRSVVRVDVLTTVSEEDGRHFAAIGGRAVHVVPNGVDCDAYQRLQAGRPHSDPLILFVGALSWLPNQAAARALALDIMPRVRTQIPGAKLRIVGKDPSPGIRALERLCGVEVCGSVPEIMPHLAEATALAVPLEAGGGTRLKILEAFASGLPVVSTPIGCEGLGTVPGEHILVADQKGFAGELIRLLDDRTLGVRIALAARDFVRQRYDWSRVGDLACLAAEAAIAG